MTKERQAMKQAVYGVNDYYPTLAIALLLLLTTWGSATALAVGVAIALVLSITYLRFKRTDRD